MSTPLEILTTPPEQEPEPEYLLPTATPKVRTIENTAALLEHKLVDTLLDILDTGTERNRLTAVDKTAEMLGKKQHNTVVVTDQLNIQQNNQNFLSHFQKQTGALNGSKIIDSQTIDDNTTPVSPE